MENNEHERFSPIKSLLGLLSFSTIIPVKQYTSIEYMTRLVWCWPYTGKTGHNTIRCK